ncbi:MAG: uracil-xanthine permease, partial [Clostridia bacterium]|nr:uracil-xanthine permease [Clostridia bacterium]
LMPPVVIGPTVAIIGLSLAGNAVGDLQAGDVATGSPYVALICGLIALAVTVLCSTYGKKMIKLIPFIMGILAGTAAATIFTIIGDVMGNDALKLVDFSNFTNLWAEGVNLKTFITLPDFTFMTAKDALKELTVDYVLTIAVAYMPVALVVFAEHVADHKNISSIIETDLLEDPGLHRTLLGDGVGSMVGAFFGGCPNTTYGESVACVAISGNASVITTVFAAIGAVAIAFFAPFVAFVNFIPACVMGGICVALYGFIAVSGLKMIQKVDLEKNRNLFVVSVILICGIGGLSLSFGEITITSIACALIMGILMNLILSREKDAE